MAVFRRSNSSYGVSKPRDEDEPALRADGWQARFGGPREKKVWGQTSSDSPSRRPWTAQREDDPWERATPTTDNSPVKVPSRVPQVVRDRIAEEREGVPTKAETESQDRLRSQTSAALRHTGKVNVTELTGDGYYGLTPEQRAAVDVNSQLYAAIVADKEAWKQGGYAKDEGDEEYRATVEELFGKEGGSGMFAPRTVALLRELGLENDKDAPGDLDNYLNLSALLSSDDIAGMNSGATGARADNAQRFSEAAVTRLADTLKSGQTLLDTARNRTGNVDLFGEGQAPIGFNPLNDRDKELNLTFEILANSEEKVTSQQLQDQISALVNAFPGLTSSSIYNYFDNRLKQYEYGRAAGDSAAILGGSAERSYLSPEEFRARYFPKGG